MADEADAQLARMRKAMARLSQQGRQREFDAVAEAYAVLKRERMERAEEEYRAAARARRVARAAERPRPPVESRPWRLPAGFGVSPLAAQRARAGVGGGPVVPDSRRPTLNPWRGSHPAARVVWRPGR